MIPDLFKLLPATIGYWRYATPLRRTLVIAIVCALDFLFAVVWNVEVPAWTMSNLKTMIAIVSSAVAVTLLVPTIGFAGLGPAIWAIQTTYGSQSTITPYAGPWIFARRESWYWGAWSVVAESGARYAVLTLGSEVKDEVEMDQPPPPAADAGA